jgi:hypothetical protein
MVFVDREAEGEEAVFHVESMTAKGQNRLSNLSGFCGIIGRFFLLTDKS